MNLVD